MTAALLNFDGLPGNPPALTQGADYTAILQLLDAANDALDLTGWTGAHLVAANPYNGAQAFDLTPGSGMTITAATGSVQIDITNTQTQAVQYDGAFVVDGRKKLKLVYDFFMIDPLGTRYKLLYGEITIFSSVTPDP